MLNRSVTPLFTDRHMPDRTGISDSTRALWAARLAERWNDLRARRDAELHCRQALALQRHRTNYHQLLPHQQNTLNHEIATVLRVFTARLTDASFDFLSHDRRAKLEPEVGTAVRS